MKPRVNKQYKFYEDFSVYLLKNELAICVRTRVGKMSPPKNESVFVSFLYWKRGLLEYSIEFSKCF